MAIDTSAKVRLTHQQKDQFELACERYREAQGTNYSQEQIHRQMIRRFCVDQGVRFTLTERRKRKARSGGT
jgi:hypothetical protein